MMFFDHMFNYIYIPFRFYNIISIEHVSKKWQNYFPNFQT